MLAFCIQLSTQGNSILLVLRVLFALELRHEIRRHSMCKFDHDCLWYIRSLLPCNLTFHPSFNKKSYLTTEVSRLPKAGRLERWVREKWFSEKNVSKPSK